MWSTISYRKYSEIEKMLDRNTKMVLLPLEWVVVQVPVQLQYCAAEERDIYSRYCYFTVSF
jgi:hypothetical protein